MSELEDKSFELTQLAHSNKELKRMRKVYKTHKIPVRGQIFTSWESQKMKKRGKALKTNFIKLEPKFSQIFRDMDIQIQEVQRTLIRLTKINLRQSIL